MNRLPVTEISPKVVTTFADLGRIHQFLILDAIFPVLTDLLSWIDQAGNRY